MTRELLIKSVLQISKEQLVQNLEDSIDKWKSNPNDQEAWINMVMASQTLAIKELVGDYRKDGYKKAEELLQRLKQGQGLNELLTFSKN